MGQDTKRIAILGFGGVCVDIAETLDAINQAAGRAVYECIGFLDDDPAKKGRAADRLTVLGPMALAADMQDVCFVNGIGSSNSYRHRKAIIERSGVPERRFETVVHPRADVSPSARLGNGVVVMPNVSVCSNVELNNHVMLLHNSVIGHDTSLGACTIVTAGVSIAGRVSVGHCCYLGTGCSIRNDVSIGHGSLIGMGATVLHDVPPDSVMVGSPARFLRPATLDP